MALLHSAPARFGGVLARCGLAVLLLLVAGGCAKSTTIRYQAAGELNRNEFDESTPVVLQIFELRRPGQFRQAAFDALWAKPAVTLAEDLVRAPDEVVVFPVDGVKEYTIKPRDAETEFIGIIGLFRKTRPGQQRSLLLAVDDVEDYKVYLSGYGLQLVRPSAEPPVTDDSAADASPE